MVDIIRYYISNLLSVYPWLAILFSFLLGYYCMPFILKVAIRKQLVVKPNKRSSHTGRIPNIGGLNIFTSFFVTMLIFSFPMVSSFELSSKSQLILVGLYVIFLVGFIDDLLAISPRKKLMGELLAAFILVVMADVRLTSLHGFFFIGVIPPNLVWVSYLVSAFLFLLIINSLNLIDGVDGLATGIGMLICAFFGIYFQIVGELNLAIMAYCMIGSLAIFFIYNVFGGRYKIFMGDSGALVLGFVVYIFVISFCQYNLLPEVIKSSPYYIYAAPAVAACVLAVPLFDTLRVMITRIKNGVSPFYADKNHVHHLLLSLGLKHRQVTLILVLVNLSFVLLAVIGRTWHNWLLGGCAVLLAIAYTFLLWRVVDRHKKRTE